LEQLPGAKHAINQISRVCGSLGFDSRKIDSHVG
jgi:hypothetical protein